MITNILQPVHYVCQFVLQLQVPELKLNPVLQVKHVLKVEAEQVRQEK